MDAASGTQFGKNNAVDPTNAMPQPAVNKTTCVRVITPRGKCLFSVRGFAASILWSTKRLNAIAALLANTMHIKIPTISWNRNVGLSPDDNGVANAITVANAANGNANTV